MADYSLVSVDVETTGPSPSTGELCSIGAIVLDENLEVPYPFDDRTFYVNLKFPSVLAKMDADTMKWWKDWPKQWELHRAKAKAPAEAMWAFVAWLEKEVSGKPLFVAWPVGFDWGFINYYFHRYVGKNPFGYSPLCLKNYAAGLLRNPQMLMGSREEASMPEGWLVEPESVGMIKHHALGDAVAQAYMIRNIMRWTDGQ